MRQTGLIGLTTAGLAAIAITACSGGGDGGSSNGTLTVQVTDASVDDVDQIWVEFTGIRLQPQGGPALDFPFPAPLQIDMLTLTDGNSETLLNGVTVPAGAYNWMELQVNAEFDSVLDSYVRTLSGGTEEIRVPSGSQTGLRLVSGFTITADQHTSFLIDWDMRLGLADAPGQPGFLLRPAMRIIDLTEYGTLDGTIAMSLVTDPACTNDLSADTGNAVYIYDTFDTTVDSPDDIDGATGPTPVATATVTQATNGDYVYGTILSPGDYVIAFTCQAGDDEVGTDEDIAFVLPADPDVTIADGDLVTVDF